MGFEVRVERVERVEGGGGERRERGAVIFKGLK